MKSHGRAKFRKKLIELSIFAMFGVMMFTTKKVMEILPNIHLIGMFIILLTLVYRSKALIPIYLYVFLDGLFAGFSPWWMPYLYIWNVLWAIAMLIPRNKSKLFYMIVCPAVGALHGMLFGLLYAPANMLMMSLTLKQTITWIIAGLPFDCLHAAGNFVSCMLVYPLYKVLEKLDSKIKDNINI